MTEETWLMTANYVSLICDYVAPMQIQVGATAPGPVTP